MTFLEMQTATLRNLGAGSSNAYFPAAEVKSAVNEACLEIAKEARANTSYWPIATADGTQRYTLPSDVLQLAHVEIDITSTHRKLLVGLSFEEFAEETYDNYSLTGEPEFYKLEWGAVDIVTAMPADVYLWPVPNTASWTLRCYGIQRPTTLTLDADISELPVELHLTVSFYAAMLLALKDNDMQRHGALAQMYVRAMSAHTELHHKRETSRKRPARRARTRRRIGERSGW
jgi:hypothetical protein